MLSIETTFNARLTRDFLNAVGQDLNELRPLLEQWLEFYRTKAQPAIFAAHAEGKNGGAGHVPWKALSDVYLRSAEKTLSNHPKDMLQLSGAFAEDITRGGSKTVLQYDISANSASVTFGSGREYAVWAGANSTRPAMYITPETARELDHITNSFLSQLIVKHRTGGNP